MESLLWTIFGALLGSILSYFIPLFIETRKYKRRLGLEGKWISYYEPPDQRIDWIKEEVNINVKFGEIQILNVKNNESFNYRCFGKFVNKTYLIGKWVSEVGNREGIFALTVTTTNKAIYGFYTGPDERGATRFCRWILAKKPEFLEEAEKLLS